jgi:hypothetical protein
MTTLAELIIDNSIVAPELWIVDNKTRYLYKGYGIYFEVNNDNIIVACPGERKEFSDYLDAVKMINNCLQLQIKNIEMMCQYELELMNELELMDD